MKNKVEFNLIQALKDKYPPELIRKAVKQFRENYKEDFENDTTYDRRN